MLHRSSTRTAELEDRYRRVAMTGMFGGAGPHLLRRRRACGK